MPTKKKAVKKPGKESQATREARELLAACHGAIQMLKKENADLRAHPAVEISPATEFELRARIDVLERAIRLALATPRLDPNRTKVLQDALTPPVDGKAG